MLFQRFRWQFTNALNSRTVRKGLMKRPLNTCVDIWREQKGKDWHSCLQPILISTVMLMLIFLDCMVMKICKTQTVYALGPDMFLPCEDVLSFETPSYRQKLHWVQQKQNTLHWVKVCTNPYLCVVLSKKYVRRWIYFLDPHRLRAPYLKIIRPASRPPRLSGCHHKPITLQSSITSSKAALAQTLELLWQKLILSIRRQTFLPKEWQVINLKPCADFFAVGKFLLLWQGQETICWTSKHWQTGQTDVSFTGTLFVTMHLRHSLNSVCDEVLIIGFVSLESKI